MLCPISLQHAETHNSKAVNCLLRQKVTWQF